jgi:hypothetical protein
VVLNTLVCVFTFCTGFVWVPFISLLAYLWNVLVYDWRMRWRWDEYNYGHTRLFPLLHVIFAGALLGVGSILFALVLAVLSPVAALLLEAAGLLRWTIRAVWDTLIWALVLAPRGRQPMGRCARACVCVCVRVCVRVCVWLCVF